MRDYSALRARHKNSIPEEIHPGKMLLCFCHRIHGEPDDYVVWIILMQRMLAWSFRTPVD